MTAHWKEAAEYDAQQLLRRSALVQPAKKCALSGVFRSAGLPLKLPDHWAVFK